MLSTFALGTEGFLAGSSFPGSGICFLYTDFGVPTYYQIAILGLIALFGMKEMLMVSERKDRFSTDSMDMGIYPLMVCFMATFFSIGINIIISQLSP
jgi:membrane protein insertase Oxa1/YidC/SpoIIIJ